MRFTDDNAEASGIVGPKTWDSLIGSMPTALTGPHLVVGYLPDYQVLPGDRDQIYELEKDELYRAGTSEVPLAGLPAGQILADCIKNVFNDESVSDVFEGENQLF